MAFLRSLLLVASACMLTATASEVPPDETGPAYGAELLVPFKTELKQALIAGMQQGPLQAIGVCKEQAPAIAAAMTTNDVALGRTSHRLRNPANTAPDWADAVLRDYLADSADRAPRTVSLEGGREGYAEPILMQALCLTCHGTTIAPEIAAYLDDAYPEDTATGFELGELRGIFWVEYSRTALAND